MTDPNPSLAVVEASFREGFAAGWSACHAYSQDCSISAPPTPEELQDAAWLEFAAAPTPPVGIEAEELAEAIETAWRRFGGVPKLARTPEGRDKLLKSAVAEALSRLPVAAGGGEAVAFIREHDGWINTQGIGKPLVAADIALQSDLDAARERVRELEAAIEPFALLAARADRPGAIMSDPLSKWFTVAQLHAADAALSQPVTEGEG